MGEIKLQYSIICKLDQKQHFKKIIHGFTPGPAGEFYVANKWVWDIEEASGIEDGYYQVTELLEDEKVIASSHSGPFRVKLSHTHHNRFQGIVFRGKCRYRIRVCLFNQKNNLVESGSLIYPVYVKGKK